MATIADRIKFVRKHFHLNQVDFSTILGISQTHISKIEAGKDNPSNKVLLMICSEFNINMDWLKDGVGVMQSQAERNPTANEIALRIKKFLIEANPIESDLCGSFLVNVPDLFKCGRGKADKYSGDIVLQITDLLDNVYKLNTSLNAATQYITKSESTEKAVDEVFWIKQNYEQRILQNIDNLVNLYLGR